MKKMIYILLGLVLFLFGANDVYALSDYGVVINNGITVYNLEDGSVVGDYSDILTYKENTLSINEGIYIEYIEVSDAITITSNDEQVYINRIENKNNTNALFLNNLNMDIYDKDSLNKMHITAKGNINILDSDIDLTAVDTKANGIESYDNVVIDNSNVKVIASVTAWDNMTINESEVYAFGNRDKYIYGHVEANNEKMTITNSKVTADYRVTSKLDFVITNSTVTSINYAIESYKAALTIIDSEVDADYEIYCGTDLIIKNSKVDVIEKNNSSNVGYIQLGGSLVMEDSLLQLSKYASAKKNVSLSNSTLKTYTKDGYVYGETGYLEVIDSEVDIYYYFYGAAKTTISNSDVTIQAKDETSSGYISSRGEMIINDSNITCYGYLNSNSVMTIKNSSINNLSKGGEYVYLWGGSDLYLENSDVNLGSGSNAYLSFSKSVNITDSEVYITGTDTGYGYINAGADINIDNSIFESKASESYLWGNVISIVDSDVSIGSYINANVINVENSNLDVDKKSRNVYLNIKGTGDSKFINSNVKINGVTRTSGSLILKDSYFYTENRSESDTYSSLIVSGDLDIDNSRVIVSSTSIMPAVLVKGNINLNDDTVFKDDNKKELEIITTVVNESNFLYNPSNLESLGNSYFVSSSDEVKTVSLNGVLSKYAETEGYYYVTLKVVNGKWNDNSTEDIRVKILLGEQFDENKLPTDMIANDGYQSGDWSTTGENELTYTFVEVPVVENPEEVVPEEPNQPDEPQDDIEDDYIENPDTGLLTPILIYTILVVLSLLALRFVNKSNKFRRI